MSNELRNPYWPSTFDELITFYPRFYREVDEMVAILKAEGKLLDDVLDGAELVLMNCFIDTADEPTLKRLEKWLGISLYSTRTLEDRRRFIRSFFTGVGKVSASAIAETIYAYTGASTRCEFKPIDDTGNNHLFIYLDRGDEETFFYSDALQLLERQIPAHISFTPMVSFTFPVAISKTRTILKRGFDFSGTKPETMLVGALHRTDAVTETHESRALTTYRPSRASGVESETGRYPRTSTLADSEVIDAATEAEPFGVDVDYIPCGTILAHS